MEHVVIDELSPDPHRGDIDRRTLTDALGTTDVAINRYRLAPGERFSGSVHAHMDQEEVFVVLEGTATFETHDGTVRVGDGEAVRFAPGEFQSGYNAGEEDLVTLAIGAPRDSEDVRIARIEGGDDVSCPACGHDHLRIASEGAGLVCPDCGTRTTVE